ncbi:hypothetical protein LTR66_003338 [Elasticomyces elasticus]|nr:hypothetical protein LTR28_012065 [Elasticomyces elasticus]KAK4997220.1 hypothetical protein LTR66_003338 [Elasticomyces elasticus]
MASTTTTQTQTVNTAPVAIATTTNGALKAKTELKVVFGATTLGKEGAEAPEHNEIDTARVCGTSEALLGELRWQDRDLIVNSAY